jgi:hypothetical protein
MSGPLPTATKSDIEDGEPMSLVGWVQNHTRFDDGNEIYYLKDVDDEEVELKVWAAETDQYDVEDGQWYVFRDAEGDVWQSDRKLSSNRGEMSVEELDGSPDFADVPGGSTVGASELSDGGILAVDIETVSTVPEDELDLDDSAHLELLCMGVGFAPEPGVPGDSTVLFRTGPSPAAEAELLERFCEYVDERGPEQLVLFRGEFDLQHLRGRAARVGDDALERRVRDVFDDHRVVDLTPPGSLEDNVDDPVETYWDVYAHSLDPAAWRADHPRYDGDPEDPVVTNKDVPHFGERYLELCASAPESREHRALRELLRHYTVADIDPLFELVGSAE